jgi:isoleucyl-tRNA synthetase
MSVIRELASLGLSARSQVGVRVRQPLAAAEVVLAEGSLADELAPLLPLLTEELNVREVRFSSDAERFVSYQVKPNYKALGKRLGKDMKACAGQLNQLPASDVRAALLGGGLTLDLPSGPTTLTEEDVEVRVSAKGTFQAAGSATAVVALDSELDDDLREEGLARELINRIQGVRKDLSLGYTDRIRLHIGGDAALIRAAERFGEHIAGETLASSWAVLADPGAEARTLEVDGRTLLLQVQRAES